MREGGGGEWRCGFSISMCIQNFIKISHVVEDQIKGKKDTHFQMGGKTIFTQLPPFL